MSGTQVVHVTKNLQIRIDERNELFVIVPRESSDALDAVMIAHIEGKTNGSLHKKYLLDMGGLPLIATFTKRPGKSFDIRAPAYIKAAL